MRTEITTKDFKYINRHVEKTDYDNNEEEEMDGDDDGYAFERHQERNEEHNLPSYMQSPYYDGTH
jgi:hypothetical protein